MMTDRVGMRARGRVVDRVEKDHRAEQRERCGGNPSDHA
jgi:hypothetical protein